ncbi:MAG: response regulator [Betaproteobacteria bacterium]|nr:response regulator [Betaproteobacteria bacterium]
MPPWRERARPSPERRRSLVVDDDQTVREVMERHLTREGFAVVTANGGQEGLRLARELHPAAITLDVMMPDLDGWTVLAAIKGDPELADIPVILLTIVDEKNRGLRARRHRLHGPSRSIASGCPGCCATSAARSAARCCWSTTTT